MDICTWNGIGLNQIDWVKTGINLIWIKLPTISGLNKMKCLNILWVFFIIELIIDEYNALRSWLHTMTCLSCYFCRFTSLATNRHWKVLRTRFIQKIWLKSATYYCKCCYYQTYDADILWTLFLLSFVITRKFSFFFHFFATATFSPVIPITLPHTPSNIAHFISIFATSRK